MVAHSYYYANITAHDATDRETFKRIFASQDEQVLRFAPTILRDIARSDKRLAIELAVGAKLDHARRYTHDFFMCLAHNDTIPFELIRDDQLEKLLRNLRTATDLDDHWVNAFLKKATKRLPGAVMRLAMDRIDDAMVADDWQKASLGNGIDDNTSLHLMSHPDGAALLSELLEWARARIDDDVFTHRFSQLTQVLCRPYGEAFVAAIAEWMAGGTTKHFEVIGAVLQDAGPEFIINNEGFLSQALRAARNVDRRTHRALSSAIYSASITGIRTGIPGQPYEVDVRIKAMADMRLANLTKTDPAFDIYRDMREHAANEIERRLAEGRRMDEEDMDA